MNVVLFGATGMVGHGVLTALLEDPAVTAVTAISRRTTGRSDPKLHEIIHRDFTDYRSLAAVFAAADATLWCLGVPSGGKSEAEYSRVTVDFPLAAASMTTRPFVYVSAQRSDSTSRTMWIKIKGRAEEALTAAHPEAFLVRPGLIRPSRGARPSTPSQRVAYAILTPLFPLLTRLFPAGVTSTDAIARAMLEILHAPATVPRRLGNTAINEVAARGSGPTTTSARPPLPRESAP
jgi:uncharacterized protein YbjT (DUF2867 family)